MPGHIEKLLRFVQIAVERKHTEKIRKLKDRKQEQFTALQTGTIGPFEFILTICSFIFSITYITRIKNSIKTVVSQQYISVVLHLLIAAILSHQ